MNMINRAQRIEIIKGIPNKDFQDEISYFMDLDREEFEGEFQYDEVCALIDLEESLENAIENVKGTNLNDYRSRYRHQLKTVREVLIAVGFYRVMTQEEIDSTTTSNGRVPWVFKMKKVAYTNGDNTTWEWLEGK